MLKLILTLFLCLLPFGVLANSPEESVADLQIAIDNQDLALFEQRINIDGVLNQLFDAFIVFYQEPGVEELLHPGAGLIYVAFTDPSLSFAKQLIFDEAKIYVQDSVSLGYLSGNSDRYNSQYDMLTPLSDSISKNRKEIRNIEKAKAMNVEKTAYQVKFELYDYENEQAYDVVGALLPNGKDWRIESIVNLDELLSGIAVNQK